MLKNNFRNLKRLSQTGRSMIEMLAVVAVIGVLSSGVYTLSGTARSKAQMTQAFFEVETIVDKTRTLYSWRANYRKIKPEAPEIQEYLMNQKVLIPMPSNSDRAKTSIGDGLTVIAERLTNAGAECNKSPCNEVFTITIYGLAKQQCIEFALFNWGPNLFRINTGDNSLFKADLPLNPAGAISLCQSVPEAFSLSFL